MLEFPAVDRGLHQHDRRWPRARRSREFVIAMDCLLLFSHDRVIQAVISGLLQNAVAQRPGVNHAGPREGWLTSCAIDAKTYDSRAVFELEIPKRTRGEMTGISNSPR